MLNSRETIIFVRDALLKQGKTAQDANGSCMLRSPDGLKCAIGHLLPDEFYDLKFEMLVLDEQYDDPRRQELLTILARVTSAPDLLLAQLQDIHDTGYPEQWEQRFNELLN